MIERNDCHIRLIKPEDNLQVEKLIIKVMTDYDCIGPEYSSSDPEVQDMYHTYTEPGSIFYVIEANNKIYGCGGIAPLIGASDKICELRKMYFYEEIRGLGLGSYLLRLCLDKARELGYTQCYLETVERMDKAKLLYLKYGFKPIDHAVGTCGHQGCDSQYILDL